MLKQLSRLSIEADGRYASAQELQFLKDYLQSLDKRISAYEKIRDAEAEMIPVIESKKRAVNPDIFTLANKDITDICRRDMTNMIRCTAAAMLIDDLDRLQNGLLLWYRTIVRSFAYQHYANTTYQIVQDVVKLHLPAEEAAVALPFFRLDHTVLSN
jgi:hypothetical protein